MSQTSSTPGRVQSDDSRQHRSLVEENQRLKKAHADASRANTWALEEWDKDRKENTRIRLDMEGLRISAEEAERRAEEAERNLSRIQGRFPEVINAWRAMGQAYRNVTGVVLSDSNDAKFVPEDEGKVDDQGQSIAQASEGGEIDDQGQQSDQASQHEEADDQGQSIAPASEGEEIGYQAQESDQAGEYEEVDDQAQSSEQASQGEESYYMGQQSDQASEGEKELHSFEPETISTLEDDSQYGSSKIRVSMPRVLDSGSPQELSIKGLKGVSSLALSPPPPPPPSSPSQPQQSQSILPLMGETTSPSDQPSANDTGGIAYIEWNPKHNTQNFPVLPKGSPQIPGIPSQSTAPPIPKKPTLIPPMEISSWNRIGSVNKKGIDGSRGIHASYFTGWGDEEDSDTGDQAEEQKPKTEISGKKSVAAGKQPERPSHAKEASSATSGDPPKPIGTKSYTGTTQAPPPKVKETVQSSRTVLKPGNAAAKAAAPQTDAPPTDEADNASGFQTVQARKGRDPSDRGRGSLGRGEAGSNKGGHQGSTFGEFQYHGRGGQGGNQKRGDKKGGNQGASQGQART